MYYRFHPAPVHFPANNLQIIRRRQPVTKFAMLINWTETIDNIPNQKNTMEQTKNYFKKITNKEKKKKELENNYTIYKRNRAIAFLLATFHCFSNAIFRRRECMFIISLWNWLEKFVEKRFATLFSSDVYERTFFYTTTWVCSRVCGVVILCHWKWKFQVAIHPLNILKYNKIVYKGSYDESMLFSLLENYISLELLLIIATCSDVF